MRIKRHLLPLLPLFAYAFLIFSSYIDTEQLMGTRDAYLSFAILQLLTFVLPSIFFCKAKGENYIFRLKLRLFGLEKAVFLIFSAAFLIAKISAWAIGSFKVSQRLCAEAKISPFLTTTAPIGTSPIIAPFLACFSLTSHRTEENNTNNNRTHHNNTHIPNAHHFPDICDLVLMVLMVCRLRQLFAFSS